MVPLRGKTLRQIKQSKAYKSLPKSARKHTLSKKALVQLLSKKGLERKTLGDIQKSWAYKTLPKSKRKHTLSKKALVKTIRESRKSRVKLGAGYTTMNRRERYQRLVNLLSNDVAVTPEMLARRLTMLATFRKNRTDPKGVREYNLLRRDANFVRSKIDGSRFQSR